jgi:multiple sugar transport system substrate-binding protein
MKKKLVALLMAATLVLSLTACGKTKDTASNNDSSSKTNTSSTTNNTSSNDASKKQDEKITLRMAWWVSQTRHDRTVQFIETYEKAHPNVDIEYEFFSFDDYFTKLKTLVASDQVWDIFQLGGNFPDYVSKIYYLDGFVKDGTIDTSKIGDAYLNITRDTEGNLVGLSNGLNTYGIAYDVDMFKNSGVELPTSTWTWDDYAAAARKIAKATGHFGTSSFTSSEFNAGCSVYIGQQGSLGQYGFFNVGLTGMGFDDPQMLKGYIQMRADLIKEGASPDAGAEMEITNIENDFLVTGEAGMTWVAVNQFPTIYDACAKNGRTLALATLPRVNKNGNSGSVIQSSQMLCVSQDSQHKKEAAQFINWFQNSTECNNVLLGERGIPINEDVRTALMANATPGQQIMYDYVTLVGTFKTPEKVNVTSPAGQDEVVDLYRGYIQKVVSGEMTASEAAKLTYEAAEKLFK